MQGWGIEFQKENHRGGIQQKKVYARERTEGERPFEAQLGEIKHLRGGPLGNH